MQYRSEIDGLRALAVIPVVLFHAGLTWLPGGYVGVDVFFVISGFLITTLIIKDEENGKFSLLNFYERRARRILPALFFIVTFCLFPAWFWLLPNEFESFFKSVFAVPVFSSNILFWMESGYFDEAANNKPLLHTWSLAVEEQYYVLFPLIIVAIWPYGKRKVTFCLIAILGASLLAAEWGWRHAPEANYYMLYSRAWELMIGAVSAVIAMSSKFRGLFSDEQKARLAILGVFLIVFSILTYDKYTPFPSVYALVPTLGTALFLLFATDSSSVGRLFSYRPVVFIGLISYSLYLWHQPLLAFARLRAPTGSETLDAVLAVLFSVVAAWFTYRFVETPFRDRKKFSAKQIFQISIVCSISIMIVGLTGYLKEGFPSRLVVSGWGDNSHFTPAKCRNQVPESYPVECILGSKNTRPTFALWGDSFASALYEALDQKSEEKGIAGIQFIRHGCPSILGVLRINSERQKVGFAQECLEHNRETLNYLLADPAVETVVITSAYNFYFRKYEKPPLIPAGILEENATYEKIVSRLEEQTINTVNALLSGGKKVVLIAPHPSSPRSIEKAVRKTLRDGDVYSDGFAFDIDGVEKNFDVKRIKMSIGHEGLTILDPTEIFCPAGGRCSFEQAGDVLLFDGSHFSLPAAKRVANVLTGVIVLNRGGG